MSADKHSQWASRAAARARVLTGLSGMSTCICWSSYFPVGWGVVYLFTGEAPAAELLVHRDFLSKPRQRGFSSPPKR
jgi:hypothetical protein